MPQTIILALMEQIGSLRHLERLQVFGPSAEPFDFTPLTRLPILRSFTFRRLVPSTMWLLTPTQVHIVRQLASLEELDIERGDSDYHGLSGGPDRDHSSLGELLAAGHSLQQLKRVNLSATSITPTHVRLLPSLSHLVELNPMDWFSATSDFSILTQLRHLTVLTIRFGSWPMSPSDRSTHVMAYVDACGGLRQFHLEYMRIDVHLGEVALGSMLSGLQPHLTALTLAYVELPPLTPIFHVREPDGAL
jgi:hypothetical protein